MTLSDISTCETSFQSCLHLDLMIKILYRLPKLHMILKDQYIKYIPGDCRLFIKSVERNLKCILPRKINNMELLQLAIL